MTESLIPYSFVPGTKAMASEVNANFLALAQTVEDGKSYTESAISDFNTQFETKLDEFGGVVDGKMEPDLSNCNRLTNCILEIPQNINCTVSNGTITLKAGSILIFPYGKTDKTSEFPVGSDFMSTALKVVHTSFADSNFTVWAETQNDISFTPLGSYTGNGMMSVNPANGTIVQSGTLASCRSGATDSQNGGEGFYFNTDAYTLTSYANSGATVYPNISLPFIQVHRTSGSWDNIENVFNGFGYIGSTAWVDKDVTALIPNGLNSDGSLNNIHLKTNTLSMITESGTNNYDMYLNVNGKLGNTSIFKYDAKENYMVNSVNNTKVSVCIVGTYTRTAGVISNFNPNTSIRLVDANELRNELTNLIPTASKAANGYIKFANGVIIQWGSTNYPSTVTLSTPFTVTTYKVAGFLTSESMAGYEPVIAYNKTNTSFSIKQLVKNFSGTLDWIAIGY